MVKITGKLVDVDTLGGVEQVPIFLNGKIAAVSDEEGVYTLDAPPGDYRLEIRPREFMYVIRDVRITSAGEIIDKKTGKKLKKELPLSRATLS